MNSELTQAPGRNKSAAAAAVRQSCIFTVMNLAQGASSCVAPHQSEGTPQVSSPGAPGLVHFQQMSKEVSCSRWDSPSAALPGTTKVIGRWNDRLHSYPDSPRAKRCTRLQNINIFWGDLEFLWYGGKYPFRFLMKWPEELLESQHISDFLPGSVNKIIRTQGNFEWQKRCTIDNKGLSVKNCH